MRRSEDAAAFLKVVPRPANLARDWLAFCVLVQNFQAAFQI